MENLEEEILIDKSCLVKKFNNKLIVIVGGTKFSLIYQFLIFLFMIIGFSSITIILIIENIIVGVSFLSLSFFFYLFLYYIFQRNILMVDKSSQAITFKKIFIFLNKIRTFNFSEIEWLIYRRDNRDYGEMYILEIVLKEAKDVNVFKGFKEECEELGKIISEFLGKKLYSP
ncbi:MAG: hypothetical protein ACFE96_13580 [Candidatus Hermodarchaeota archaeon]